MATSSSISINYTTATGKKGQKALTNVNPDASNGVLKTFAGKVNSLTTNTYLGTTRVDKTPLKSANELKTPTIVCSTNDNSTFGTLENPVVPLYTFADYQAAVQAESGCVPYFVFEYDTDAVPYIKSTPKYASAVVDYDCDFTQILDEGATATVSVFVPANDPDCLGEFVVCWPETDTYAAASVAVTVTAGGE